MYAEINDPLILSEINATHTPNPQYTVKNLQYK
jgi:hypothetical protein